MSTLTQRRTHMTQSSKGKEPARNGSAPQLEHDKHEHDAHEQGHEHSHSHSLFSLGHSHSHAEEGPTQDPEKIVEALKGGGDRGSRITVIGLISNIVVTGGKGLAGWYMNSASLLADAGHSLSDMVGDLVTLFCWRLSRKPPSELYPYGFAKFEVLGTTTVSLLLTGGALAFGLHSWGLLMEALSHTAAEIPAGVLHDVLLNVSEIGQHVPTIASEHAHGHALDPNAAWFALASIIIKEWVYRATKKVADEERSPVLLANAIHHRSDAYSSAVALVAILGTWWFPHLPLDPIGGLFVSFLIIQQGWGLTISAFKQLTDAGVSPRTQGILMKALAPLLPSSPHPDAPSPSQIELHTENLLAIRDLRAKRAGASMFVDLVAEVPSTLTVEESTRIEEEIVKALKKQMKEIVEVKVKFVPVPRDPLA